MADPVVKPISTSDITIAAAKTSHETDAMNGNGSVAAASTTAEKGSETQPADGFTPAADIPNDIDVNNNIPTAADLEKCKDLLVLAADGSSRTFKSLYSGEGVATRQLIIFVRHFFCGNCQEYLRTLSSLISPDALLSLPTPTFITVIGCGRPELIPMYLAATSCPFPIYADPSRKLYDHLGMSRTLNLGPSKPEYMRKSMIATMALSIIQGLKMGTGATKGGDIKQVGGEFLFESGEVKWCHRMRNTRDHAEVKVLKQVLGFEDEVDTGKTSAAAMVPLTGGPVPPLAPPATSTPRSASPAIAATTSSSPLTKESRRRSVDLKGMVHRLSGDWSRRTSSSNIHSHKPKDGRIAEEQSSGAGGVQTTQTTSSESPSGVATTPVTGTASVSSPATNGTVNGDTSANLESSSYVGHTRVVEKDGKLVPVGNREITPSATPATSIANGSVPAITSPEPPSAKTELAGSASSAGEPIAATAVA